MRFSEITRAFQKNTIIQGEQSIQYESTDI